MMTSNAKAEKLSILCVQQRPDSVTFSGDKKFWFCTDYDVEVVYIEKYFL